MRGVRRRRTGATDATHARRQRQLLDEILEALRDALRGKLSVMDELEQDETLQVLQRLVGPFDSQ